MSKNFSQKILQWFDQFGRHDLPWQKNPTTYRVWVSEIMLQQTQVTTVIPYFEKFIKRFPNISALATATVDEVFQLWAGLGYYARARNLHKSAQWIEAHFQGKFPTRYEEVVTLPGIGRSTAGAILALSTQQRYAILDGNVKRVLARHFAVEGWTGDPKIADTLWNLSENLTPLERVHHYTQAMMDLGATLCTRSKPKCLECPITKTCQARKLNRVSHFPNPRPKAEKPTRASQLMMVIQNTPQTKKIEAKKTLNKSKSQNLLSQNYILLEKRPGTGIWGGLWSLPECALDSPVKAWCNKNLSAKIKSIENLEIFRHTFTHFHLMIHPVIVSLTNNDNTFSTNNSSSMIKVDPRLHSRLLQPDSALQWYSLDETDKLGLPVPVKRLISLLRNKICLQNNIACIA